MIYSFGLSKAGTHLIVPTLKEAGYEIFAGVVSRNGDVHSTAAQKKTDDGIIKAVLTGNVIDWPDPEPRLVLYGHPKYTDGFAKEYIAGYKVIFSIRDLRTRLISHFRYEQLRICDRYISVEDGLPIGYENMFKTWLMSLGNEYVTATNNYIPWKDYEGVLLIKFEELVANNSTICSNLNTFLNPRETKSDYGLGLRTSSTFTKALKSVNGKQHGTLMKHTSTWDDYTFDWLDKWYTDCGLKDLNKTLGYDL